MSISYLQSLAESSFFANRNDLHVYLHNSTEKWDLIPSGHRRYILMSGVNWQIKAAVRHALILPTLSCVNSNVEHSKRSSAGFKASEWVSWLRGRCKNEKKTTTKQSSQDEERCHTRRKHRQDVKRAFGDKNQRCCVDML